MGGKDEYPFDEPAVGALVLGPVVRLRGRLVNGLVESGHQRHGLGEFRGSHLWSIFREITFGRYWRVARDALVAPSPDGRVVATLPA